jgi:limonene-1,2-epoxide hydrolase
MPIGPLQEVTMAQDPGQLVRDFLAGMGTSQAGDIAQYRAYLSDDVVWDSGTQVYYGLEASIGCLYEAQERIGMECWSADIVHQAVNGDVVLNERVDHVLRTDGSVIADLPVMAIFEIRDDKIVAWRDHFNPDLLRAALTGA